MDRFDTAILGVAFIWAAVIFAVAVILKDTQYFAQLLPILIGGSGGSIVVLSGCRPRKS